MEPFLALKYIHTSLSEFVLQTSLYITGRVAYMRGLSVFLVVLTVQPHL